MVDPGIITDGLKVVDNVFTKEQCQWLIDYYDRNLIRENGIDRVVRIYNYDPQFSPYVEIITRQITRLWKHTPAVETVVLGCMPAREAMENHADNVKWDGTKLVPNHTPNRTFTAVVMLEDGVGGVTTFGNNEGQEKYTEVIEQKRGRLHAHRCGGLFYHSVAPSVAPRHTFIIWFER